MIDASQDTEIPEFVVTDDARARESRARANGLGGNRLPESLAHMLARLELSDRAMVQCLEAIVLSVKKDGTAVVGDVTRRYAARSSNVRDIDALQPSTGAPLDRAALSADIARSVLPRLARAALIALPPDGAITPDALITIANPWLRLALLEAGLMQLDRYADVVNAEPIEITPATEVAPSSAVTVAEPVQVEKVHVEKAHEAADRFEDEDFAESLRPKVATPHDSPTGGVLHDDWSQLWFAVKKFNWRTLAMVPASGEGRGVGAATALAAAGRLYQDGAVELIDASHADPMSVDRIIASIRAAVARKSQVIVALDSPITNPSTIPIARSLDVAVLAVQLGVPTMSSAKQTMNSIGRDYFIGSVSMRRAD